MDRRLACVLLVGGCGDCSSEYRPPNAPDAERTPNITARYEVPAPGAGADWGALPWPSDHFLGDDGKLRLLSLPVGAAADASAVTMLTEGLASMNGAGLRSNIYFPVELEPGAEIDPESVSGDDTSVGGLIDIDASVPGAPIYIPTRALWRPDLGAVVLVPPLGTVLLPGHRYGAYIDWNVQTLAGESLRRDDGFDIEAEELQPLLEVLDDGFNLDRIAAATVFTTATFPNQTKAMRDVIAAAPPTVTVTAVYGPGGTAVSTIAGNQTDDATPGNCLAAGRGQPMNRVAALLHGTIALPSFLNAQVNVDGFPEYDNGVPIVQGVHDVPFSMTLPTTSDGDWTDLPVVIYVHGIGRTRGDFLTQANTAARIGAAMIAIDLPYHGSRHPSAVDLENETLGTGDSTTPTPDGFGDERGTFNATALFHISSSGGIPGLHPRAMGENLRQAAIEQVALAAFVRDGDDGPIEAAVGTLTGLPATVTFRDEVGLVTESLGAMISGVALAVEPGIAAAYLSSAAAGFPSPSMLHSPNYSATFATAVNDSYDIADRVDAADPARDYPTDPLVMLFGNVVERGDAIAYAPLVTSGALRGGAGPNLVASMGWGDVWVSNDTEEAYARALALPVSTMALATQPDDPIRFAELDSLAWPVSGNRPGGKSGCFVVFHPTGHASIRLIQEEQNFEPEFPPYVPIDPPMQIADSLIAQQHELWGELLADHFDGGAVTITDPFNDADWFVAGSACD